MDRKQNEATHTRDKFICAKSKSFHPTILSGNIQSLLPKIETLRDMMSQLNEFDVIAIQESWLNNEIPDEEIVLEDFILFRADRCHSHKKRGGGAVIYVRKSFCKNPELLLRISDDNLDLVVILAKKSIIASVYVNKKYCMDQAVNIMCEKIIEPYYNNNIFICGDMNRAPVDTPFGMCGLNNVVKFSTRNEAYLDHVWTNVPERVLITDKCAKIADHSFVLCKDKYSKYHRPRKWMKRRIRKLNTEQLKCELETTDWDIFNSIENLDEKTDSTTAYINHCESMCTYTYEYLEDQTTGQTTTQIIKKARRKREAAFKSGLDIEFKYWSEIVLYEVAKLNSKLLLSLRKSNIKSYWESLKNLSEVSSEKIKTKVDVDLDELNQFFLRFEDKEADIKMPNCQKDASELIEQAPYLNDQNILELLSKSKCKDSRGSDNISSKILRDYKLELLSPVRSILNDCIQKGYIPEIWKTIQITPIPKGKFHRITELNQARPVGQTSALLKILEYFIKQQLETHVMNNNLDRYQFAYKQNVSTSDAVGVLISNAIMNLEQNHTISRILFLDYSSAFNTVNRQEILDLLSQKYNTPEWMLRMLLSYFDKRKQFVKVKNVKSLEIPCRTGVVQGAVLSPFFFTLITDGLRSNFDNCKIIKFADDTAVVAKVSNRDSLHEYFNLVKNIYLWSVEHHLILNTTKTHEIIVKNKNFHDEMLEINGKPIMAVSEVKYLGVIIDDRINFSSQVQQLCQNTKIKLKYASRLLRKCKQKIVVKDFVFTCIIPVLLYNLCMYIHFLNDKTIKELQKIFRRLANICYISKEELHTYIENQVNKQALSKYVNMCIDQDHPLNVVKTFQNQKNKIILPYLKKDRTHKIFQILTLKADRDNNKFYDRKMESFCCKFCK
ncbi:Uncharacterised protein r2_g1269 [Pycnogonum litorale]